MTNLEKNENYEILEPVFTENYSLIAMSSSNFYVPYLSVYLQSIVENANDNHNYDLVVFQSEISDRDKDILLKQVNRKNISLRFFNPTSLLASYDLKIPKVHNVACVYRVVSPLIFKNYEKVIFTDIDLVFNNDPKNLYAEDVSGYPLASIKDYVWGLFVNAPWGWREYAQEVLQLEDMYKYFNTGVMVLNVAEFNKNEYSKKILDLISKIEFKILEQDALNKFFQSSIKYIDTSWNTPVLNDLFKQNLELMPEDFRVALEQDLKKPKIIHWAGSEKPWSRLDLDFSEIWWGYARRTPYYEKLMERFYEKKRKDFIKENLMLFLDYHKNLSRYNFYRTLANFIFGPLKNKVMGKKYYYLSQIEMIKKIFE